MNIFGIGVWLDEGPEMANAAGQRRSDFMMSDLGKDKAMPNASDDLRTEYTCFLVDVWKHRAYLFALIADGLGDIRIYKIDHRSLDITDNDLLEAVKASGGDLSTNGSYPISQEIRDKIKAFDICFIYSDLIKSDCCEFDQKDTALPNNVHLKLFQMPCKPQFRKHISAEH